MIGPLGSYADFTLSLSLKNHTLDIIAAAFSTALLIAIYRRVSLFNPLFTKMAYSINLPEFRHPVVLVCPKYPGLHLQVTAPVRA